MSSSVAAALHRQIDELEAAIEAQKAVLQDLMSQHKQAQHRLNLFIDPMARLPLEIQSLVFLCVAPMESLQNPTPKPNTPPMVFLNVCRLWHDIALATPKLWCRIEMDSLPRGSKYYELCGAWLSRARSLPLSVSLRGSTMRLQQSVQDLVTRHRHQLEDLTLSLSRTQYLNSTPPYIYFKTWGDDSLLPCLKTLSIKSDDEVFFGPGEWLNMLEIAPNLASFSIQNTSCDLDMLDEVEAQGSVERTTISSLTDLRLGQPRLKAFSASGLGGGSSIVLKFLTLPALQNLSISYLDSADVLIHFLARSSAPLKSFDFAPGSSGWPVAQCLHLMPTITDLRISGPSNHHLRGSWDQDRFLSFLQVMSTTPDLLPNLHSLTLSTSMPVTIDYDELLRMLNVRSTRNLQCFKLYFMNLSRLRSLDADMPNDQVRSGMLELANGGMKIHVGPEYRNLL
ncbi:hypothetical protein R3P38DRAFT_1883823 [Favolaschia claudopus]|uniref:F-box domain-containing protein n=1 Tax=Favolaschia claudopus TaxID=2862362 RepID=A0AAW0D9N8_9AGAR